MRYVSTAALLLLMSVSLQGQSFRLDAGPTGSVAEEKPPVPMNREGLERIELAEPGSLTKSNVLYVLTEDVSAPGTAFTVAAGVRNTVLDLGGHVVTYNTEKQPLGPGKPYGECVYGVHVAGRGVENIVIRNGVIVQGAGANAGSHAICLSGGRAAEVHHIQSRVHGPSTSNVSVTWGGPDGRVHDNYFENHSTTLRGGLFASNGIVLSQSQPGWEIWNNTIIGGHNSIAVWNNATKEQRSAARIHHN
ncbi:MAG TPA: hypothetical protein VMY39_02635, partial [Planctomycetota bacterium]|nr:hypothetical protein [Planctomycetota bacterium]